MRTEGEIGPKTRMVYAVAQVKDPYGRGQNSDRPPLASGLFVEAMISEKVCKGVVVLPRSSLRNHDEILVVDQSQKLHFRKVKLLRLEGKNAVVSFGLKRGELVCINPPAEVVEGMRVRLSGEAGKTRQEKGNKGIGSQNLAKPKAE